MSVQVISSIVVVEPTAADKSLVVDAAATAESATDARLVESDLLVEDVSIDGMCGVY